MNLTEIGIIRSPFKNKGDAPRQGFLTDELSVIEVYPEYKDAMFRLEERSELQILYWADRADRTTLRSTSCMDKEERGVFNLRCPHRPNPILVSVVEVVGFDDNKITVRGLEALDGSPLLDIKPAIK